MAKLTPMMEQYLKIKNEHKDKIVFYRLGDFYEMFYDDALVAKKELDLNLTSRECGDGNKAPMCGIPHHVSELYISKLISKGYKVAICEQMEDPKPGSVVKREIVDIITPGSIIYDSLLDSDKNNYLMSVSYNNHYYGIAVSDVLIGDFYVKELETEDEVIDEILRYRPSELIIPLSFRKKFKEGVLQNKLKLTPTYLSDESYYDNSEAMEVMKEHFNVFSLEALGLDENGASYIAAASMLIYLNELHQKKPTQIQNIKLLNNYDYMVIDSSTRRNLELLENMKDGSRKGSLLNILDKTSTAMGARYIRGMIEKPLINRDSINERLDAVEELIEDEIGVDDIISLLSSIYDMERLMGRINYKCVNPKDLEAFKISCMNLPDIKNKLSEFKSSLLVSITNELDTLDDIYLNIDKTLVENAPTSLKDGNIIKNGLDERVDYYRKIRDNSNDLLRKMEEEEREKTGIKTLKIKDNRVFGYYIEVSNSNKELVPSHYIRRQTLSTSERYVTEELKKLEEDIISSRESLFNLEYELFCKLRDDIDKHNSRVRKTSRLIGKLDSLISLAKVAKLNNYIKPNILDDGSINVCCGRHPVIEKFIDDGSFISNDTDMNLSDNRIMLITGPNMAGKSTYMRQVAVIVLMAHIGSFVPADKADIGMVDRIFTRVGASDDIASGKSTFMVEMTEMASILRNATSRSLLILDEIGRGTGTIDGLSIATAVLEYIDSEIRAKTLFATHYHELAALEEKIGSLVNYHILIKENNDDIVFLRKIVRGNGDKSYGIQVAKLAGIPNAVINRAKSILDDLSNDDIKEKICQLSLFDSNECFDLKNDVNNDEGDNDKVKEHSLEDNEYKVINKIKEINLNRTTAIDALNLLFDLQEMIK